MFFNIVVQCSHVLSFTGIMDGIRVIRIALYYSNIHGWNTIFDRGTKEFKGWLRFKK